VAAAAVVGAENKLCWALQFTTAAAVGVCCHLYPFQNRVNQLPPLQLLPQRSLRCQILMTEESQRMVITYARKSWFFKDIDADAVGDECLLLCDWHCVAAASFNSCDCETDFTSEATISSKNFEIF